MRFLEVAQTAEAVAQARGTHAKRDHAAALFARVEDDGLPHVARFLTGMPFGRADARVLQVGGQLLQRAALAIVPYDAPTWQACLRAVGDAGETLALLVEAHPPHRESAQRTLTDIPQHAPTVQDVAAVLDALAATPTTVAKAHLLERTWRRMSSLEVKYFTKLVAGGMRIGSGDPLVEDAIARAFGRDTKAVRHAHMLSGDIGETATLARTDRLQEARFRMFHPLGFMLATAVDAPPADLATHAIEDKYDGIRAQLHAAPGRVAIYTRALDLAGEFPELEEAAHGLRHEVVLDGEIVATRPDVAMETLATAPFGTLQRRLGRKHASDAIRREVPVRFVVYDVLFIDGEPLWRRPWQDRRATLDALSWPPRFHVSPLHDVHDQTSAWKHFTAARSRGNEGLVFKRRDSPYEMGRRGRAWLKLKQPFATLDVVVTAAEMGSGRRAGLLSDVTFAVCDEEGQHLNVGKAYTGLTDVEIRDMTSRLRSLTTERHAGVHLVRPEIVLEVAFDGVTKSARHKSGYALRFPRIVRWRHDKRASEVDTLARVEELWRKGAGVA